MNCLIAEDLGKLIVKPGAVIYYKKGEDMGFQQGFPTTLATMRDAAFSHEKGMYNRRLSPVDHKYHKPSITEIANSQIDEAVESVKEAQDI